MSEPVKGRVGVYRLVRRLGSGGMGEVFLAWDDRLERPVAAKRLRQDRETGGVRRERFRREARTVARLNHPNIVQIFDLVEGQESGDWIVMEYVQGRPLSDLLQGGPLPAGAAVDLARQVAEGLAAAHAQGLVHRDLKAENVMVTPAGQAKILDFGLARPLDGGSGATLTDDGAILGTWRAMSPEQASGGPADARSDLFSLGILMYEALAGRSPFLGKTPIETLRNLTSGPPEPLGRLCPDLPPDLSSLVGSLLEKDPARRPSDANWVAAKLRTLAERSELAPPAGWPPAESASANAEAEAPTVLEEPIAGVRGSFLDSGRSWVRIRSRGLIASLVALAAVAVLAALWGRWPLSAGQPLRVAVLAPAGRGPGGEALDLAAAGVLTSALRTLLSLQGVTPVDPAQIGDVKGGAAQIARAVSAGEVLTSAVAESGPTALVSLQRVRASDGSVLWAESVQVPAAPKDALVLANAVAAALRRAYSDRAVRPGYPDLSVRAEDYIEFLRIKQRIDAGRTSWAPELDRLEEIAGRSPNFLDAHLLAATIATNLYEDSKDSSYLERTRASLRRARSLAPEVPGVLALEIRLAARAKDWDRAEQALGELERLAPGEVLIPLQRATLAFQRGRTREAIRWMQAVVARQPAWRDLLWLADLETRAGDSAAARRHLEEALNRVPGNTWVLAKLGELELLHGDLGRAERIYGDLVRSGPQRSDLTNLGLVHFLMGRYEQAVSDYRKALALEPGHLTVTLNLADAELALGHPDAAAGLYRQVLSSLEAKRRSATLQPVERTIAAQCLARLGQRQRAVETALEALQESPQDAEVAYQAALVFSLAGERTSAVALARKALHLGVQPRWFAIPGFDQIRADLQRLQ